MKSTLAWLLMTGAPLVIATPAFADLPTPTPTPPAANQAVLMRRPLDLRNGNGTPTSTTPTPTPPGTPGDPGKPVNDPDVPVYVPDGPDPGQCQGVLQWSYGSWQGYGSCGETAHLTRTIGCQCNTLNIGGGDGGWGPIGSVSPGDLGKPEVMQASWDMSTSGGARLSSGVYDPASSDVKAHLAQFGGEPGSGDGFKVTDVPVSYCLAELGPAPANSYTGQGASCGYHEGTTPSYAAWQIDPGSPGTVTCSSQAYRKVTYPCLDGNDNQVDSSFCSENIEVGGYHQDYDSGHLEYGNYSGCTAKWVAQGSDIGCWENPGDSDLENTQAVHYAYYNYVCEREDGRVLTGVDEAACPIGKPSNKRVAIGSCSRQLSDDDIWFEDFAPGATKGMCASQVVFCWASKEYPDNGCMGTPDSPNYPNAPKAGDKRDPNDPAEWALWNYDIGRDGKLVPNGGGMSVCYNEYRPNNYPPIPDIN
jgi:hypothetical protein